MTKEVTKADLKGATYYGDFWKLANDGMNVTGRMLRFEGLFHRSGKLFKLADGRFAVVKFNREDILDMKSNQRIDASKVVDKNKIAVFHTESYSFRTHITTHDENYNAALEAAGLGYAKREVRTF